MNGHGGMPDDFAREDHNLQRLSVTTRHGAIFVSEAMEMESLEDYLGPKMLVLFDRVFDGRPLARARRLSPAHSGKLEADVREHQGSLSRQPAARVSGDFRPCSAPTTRRAPRWIPPAATARSSRGAAGDRAASSATEEMASFREKLELHDPRLLDIVKEFPDSATVVMQTIWPNLIVQQQANTLATRQIVPVGPEAFDLVWTFFGYDDDDEAMRARRLRHANLMGPAGFVSLDDSEVMDLAQRGIHCDESGQALVEMGGRGTEDHDHIVTETRSARSTAITARRWAYDFVDRLAASLRDRGRFTRAPPNCSTKARSRSGLRSSRRTAATKR